MRTSTLFSEELCCLEEVDSIKQVFMWVQLQKKFVCKLLTDFFSQQFVRQTLILDPQANSDHLSEWDQWPFHRPAGHHSVHPLAETLGEEEWYSIESIIYKWQVLLLCQINVHVLKPRNSLPNQIFDRDLKGGEETDNTDWEPAQVKFS